ncbi:hypothetical protein LguiB_009587 [Lonicera macranthoides]
MVSLFCERDELDTSSPQYMQMVLFQCKPLFFLRLQFYNQDLLVVFASPTSTFHGKIGETPLYIAARRGFHELVDVILNNCEAPIELFQRNLARGKLGYSFYCILAAPECHFNGNSISLGLATSQIDLTRVPRSYITRIMQIIQEFDMVMIKTVIQFWFSECTRKLLEWKETIVREKDSNGQMPLHYAAYFGFSSITCQLLHVDPSTAYVTNKDYSETALHIAAIRGHVAVMKEILLTRPDFCSMVNNHGRNVLHLAIENNQKKVIEYIIEECPVISSLINLKDADGNAPSHLLELSICNVPKLIQHDMVDKEALMNNKNLSHLGSVIKYLC